MTNILQDYSTEKLLDQIDNDEIDLDKEEIDIDSENYVDTNENRKLYVNKVDKSTSDLFRMIIEGELNLQPDYQRKFVWDKKTMSKFIESLLLSIPVPTIFLAENNDNSFEVIDGQQRLTTIFAFMKSKLNEEERLKLTPELEEIEALKLYGLETLKQYNKKGYLDLEDIQRKFNNVSLPMVIIQKDSTEDIKYDIFARINSGSIKLNNQELLNVMYRGVLLKKLNEIALEKSVDDLFGNRPVLKKRFGYHEILLRARAMECFINNESWNLQEVQVRNPEILGKSKKKYNGRLNSVILDYLKEFRNSESESNNLSAFLNDAIKKVEIVFADNAFKRVGGVKSTSINKTIAELQLVVLSKFDLKMIEENKEKIRDSFVEFIDNSDENMFIRGTNNTKNVEKRYEWGRVVSEILGEA